VSNGSYPDADEMPYYEGRMGNRRSIVDAKRDEINALVHRHHGHGVSLFGSVARGDDTADSDIDFLVEFDAGSSLFDLMDLQEALEQLLGVPVDVVSVGGLKDREVHFRQEAVPI
jgi:hypothetical protein